MQNSSLINQNPREASSWSRIFLISLVYLCMYLFLSRLLAKRKTIQTWYLAHILALTSSKTCFRFVEKILVTASSLERLPCHVDFPHISSIAFLYKFQPSSNLWQGSHDKKFVFLQKFSWEVDICFVLLKKIGKQWIWKKSSWYAENPRDTPVFLG